MTTMKKRAQTVLEYAMIISVVVVALTAMSMYVQRAVQGHLKIIEEQVNSQPTVATAHTP